MALNCKISHGIAPICETKVSGIKKLWVANWDESHTFTSSDDCEVDTIDMGTEKFYALAIEDQTGYFTADLTVGSSNDSKAINHTVGFNINHISCDFMSDWKNFLLGTVIFAVLDNNRNVWIVGADNGVTSTTFNYASGTANGDASGVNAVFEGLQPNFLLKVKDVALIKALEA